MNVRSKLDMEFSKQKGLYSSEDGACLQKSIITAEGYAITECALAVLSDLKEHKSYIFDGGFAQTLDIDASVCNGKSIQYGSRISSMLYILMIWK